MDRDLIHDPTFIPILLKKAGDRDIIIGSRLTHGGKIVDRNPLWGPSQHLRQPHHIRHNGDAHTRMD
jgi:hypothetical protein